MNYTINDMNEKELIALCKTQLPYIPTGFEELVKRNQKMVFNLCRSYLKIESDAEDATQEVFMKVFHALPSFDGRSTFKTWLFSIAMNHCKTILSKNQRNQSRYEYGDDETINEYSDGSDTSFACVESEDDKNCINSMILKLKTEEQDMLRLRFNSELGLDEIAQMLGKKLSATKMGFYRAIEKFKALYERHCL